MQHRYGCDLDGDEMTEPCLFCDSIHEGKRCFACFQPLPHEHVENRLTEFKKRCIEVIKVLKLESENAEIGDISILREHEKAYEWAIKAIEDIDI